LERGTPSQRSLYKLAFNISEGVLTLLYSIKITIRGADSLRASATC